MTNPKPGGHSRFARGGGNDPGLHRFRPLSIVAAGVVIAFLFFARDVFVPLSMAVLLSFLLATPCTYLERKGVRRTLSVAVVVGFSFVLFVGLAWLVSSQFYDLAKKLPDYHSVIEEKLKSLKSSPNGTVSKFSKMVQHMAEELEAPDGKEQIPDNHQITALPSQTEAIPVEIHQPRFGFFDVLWGVTGPILRPVGTGFMVLVVLIFMLHSREDLRNRMIRLAGTDRMDLTTDTLDEAAQRVSRYLSMQLLVNCCFGFLVGTGLHFIGMPSPWLWGVLALILRFIPFVGPWIAAVPPMMLALAIVPGWEKLAWTTGLFMVVELITSNLVEPVLYGSSTGVSPVALILAAIFWTWLWGPVGLLLSTPLTVCLAVIGLHMPRMRVLHVLLGDEPVLTPETLFYQRLLAKDRQEADGIVEAFLKEKPLTQVCDELLVPALSYAKEDLASGRLGKEKENFIFDNITQLIEDLAEERNDACQVTNPPGGASGETKPAAPAVVVIPARGRADEVAGLMFKEILGRRAVHASVLSSSSGLTADCLEVLAGSNARIVCISAVAPNALRRGRHLCKKIRAAFPEIRIIVALWGGPHDLTAAREALAACAPDFVASTFEPAAAAVIPFASSVAVGEVEPAVPALQPA